MKRIPLRRERGSVLALTAVAMFPAMFLMAFAIDISHWFDYSRNLQNRADAAALAAGAAFGNICLEGATGGSVLTGPQSALGKWAQLYSGAGVGEPVGNLPYTDAAVSAAPGQASGTGPGTGWPVATNGYINNTLPASPVASALTLKKGSLSDYWVVLNGNDYAENGGKSFSMISGGTGATFCNSDPKQDLTDPGRASAGAAGPMVDVKVSQRNLPLFFQGLFPGIHPNIHAHARVALQGEASTPSAPIAVSDSGYTPCVTVYFKSTADNSILGTAVLTKQAQVLQTDPIIWTNAAAQTDSSGNPIPNTGPTAVAMPNGANVYVQPFLNNCNGSGTTYDDSTTNPINHSGVLLINSYGNSTPGANEKPVITTGGVTLNNLSCAPDQFFAVATGGCNIQVTANVAFTVAANKASVTAVDTSTGNTLNLNGSGTTWTANGAQHLTIDDSSGQHPIRIDWEQNAGSITGLGSCVGGAGNPCKGSFGIQAQAFGACDGCDQPDDSGPIILARVRKDTDGAGAFGPNAYSQTATPNLVVTLQLAGLNAAPATATAADDAVLRYPVSGNHQTGLIDCGQGPGGSSDAVVYYGCGPANPQFTPPLNPVFVYSRPPGSDCSPATDGNTTGWPSGNHQDCVATVPGTKNPICPLVLRMTGQPFGPNCNNNATCPANNWPNVPSPDPRAITMIITSPSDFGAAGGPQGWLPIRRFATFYVTGWDTRINPSCPGINDPFPVKGKRNQQNEAMWGHWISYSDTAGTSNGQTCPVNSVQPINCVPALTR